jgi:hypothetical protein
MHDESDNVADPRPIPAAPAPIVLKKFLLVDFILGHDFG